MLSALVWCVAVWTFTVTFFRHQDKYISTGETHAAFADEIEPSYSVLSLLNWFAQIATKYILLALPCIAVIIAFTPFITEEAMQNSPLLLQIVFCFAFLWAAAAVTWGFFAFLLVSPISVLKKGFAFKESLAMTKGHLWKISYHYCMILLIFWFITLACGVILYDIGRAFGTAGSVQQAIKAIVVGTSDGLLTAALSVYTCMVYRALKKA